MKKMKFKLIATTFVLLLGMLGNGMCEDNLTGANGVTGGEQDDYLTYSLPFVKDIDGALDTVGGAVPLVFSAQALFMSHWLDEGSNPSPNGMNIHQKYSAAIPVFDHFIGYEYFQADFEKARPHTLERDHTIFAELNFGLLTLVPSWTYVDNIEDSDSGEIGLAVALDVLLNPEFSINYDYDEEKGYYCEWGISHDFDFGKFGTFTPSMVMGLNSRKGIDKTCLTHIDWGLEYTLPLSKHLNLAGFLHFTKGLEKDEGFESIVPWGGFGLNFEL